MYEHVTLPKDPLEVAVEDGQECLKAMPVIVLGSGASIPFGLPSMKELAQRLSRSTPEAARDVSDAKLWDCFTERLRTQDLESALTAVQLTERLSDYVVRQTWGQISVADVKVFENLIADANLLPLTRLYRHLFGSTHRKVSVVTTNYDRLAEYGADRGRFCHYTGFTYGYFRQRQTSSRISFLQGAQSARTIDIWKVHGSLDWFMNADNHVIAFTSAGSIPAGFRPAIVTPGISKYEQTHSEPFRTVIAGADNALTRATAYLCIGFGFNDEHIQPKLKERWQQGEAFLLVLTKALSDSAKRMLASANGQKFLALEDAPTGTRMWSHRYRDETLLEKVRLWNLPEFLDQTL